MQEARALSPEHLSRPENFGKRMILTHSADDYFFGGDKTWQNFVRDHFENFQVSYLATRRMRGRKELDGLSLAEQTTRALAGAASLDGVYDVDNLDRPETDLQSRFGKSVRIADRRTNVGVHPEKEPRWPRLVGQMEGDSSVRRLEGFVDLDEALMARLFPHGFH